MPLNLRDPEQYTELIRKLARHAARRREPMVTRVIRVKKARQFEMKRPSGDASDDEINAWQRYRKGLREQHRKTGL